MGSVTENRTKTLTAPEDDGIELFELLLVIAREKQMILRADGSVQSAQNTSSIFGGITGQSLMPGDTVIVPELLDKFSLTRELKDWAQIFYQFALGVGAIHLLRL